MHAIYGFLVDVPKGDEGLKKVQEAYSNYESSYCDENNWASLDCLITADGRAFKVLNGVEWEFKKSAGTSLVKKYKGAKGVWECAVHFALECAAVDMELFGSSPYAICSTGEENGMKKIKEIGDINILQKEILKETALVLSKMFASFANNPKFSTLGSEDWMDSYRREKMASHLEFFVSSSFAPFATNTQSPYKYRFYDLRGDTSGHIDEGSEVGILFVDIHT